MYDYDEFDDYGITQYTIEDVRKDLNKIVEYFRAMPYHEHAMKLFLEEYRQMPKDVADISDAFCVDEELSLDEYPEWMFQESLGFIKNNHVPMAGRCVFPVKDVNGDTMGFCGWDPFVSPKYLDSRNYGYKAKRTTFYGMENLKEYYESKEPVFITEGLMCSLYLRSKGFHAMASLGSHLTMYQIQILKRFGSRLIMVPDNDEAGNAYAKQASKVMKGCIIYQCKYAKDIDDLRRVDDFAYEDAMLNDLHAMSNPFCKTETFIRYSSYK